MPFIPISNKSGASNSDECKNYKAVVVTPAFNAEKTIEPTMSSVLGSIQTYWNDSGNDDDIALSIVDDASSDATASVVAAFAESTPVDVFFRRNEQNSGRAYSRNKAVEQAKADHYFFLDHDDQYLPNHISSCLTALTDNPRADFVKTWVVLSDPVHPEWEQRIAAGLTQNLCVRSYCHRMIGGFHEEPEVETYGCDDLLYNRLLRAFFRPEILSTPTVYFRRWPGNSFDRQYEKKFSRPPQEAEITLSEEQLRVEPAVMEIHQRRHREVLARMLGVARLRPSPPPLTPPPKTGEGDFGCGLRPCQVGTQTARQHFCPVCERHGRFFPIGRVPRPNAQCSNCGALERHRLLWVFLNGRTNLFDQQPKRMLHVAPEPILQSRFRQIPRLDYLTADLHDPRAMVEMDITDIRYPNDSFDVICCSHVLEHVADDRRAMRELHRVLSPGGWAVLLVPITSDHTFEDPTVTDPEERERLFGQSDHVRRYGPDVADRLTDAGFGVRSILPGDVLSAADLQRMAVRGEPLYYCTKSS